MPIPVLRTETTASSPGFTAVSQMCPPGSVYRRYWSAGS